jgi:hypothetical protein
MRIQTIRYYCEKKDDDYHNLGFNIFDALRKCTSIISSKKLNGIPLCSVETQLDFLLLSVHDCRRYSIDAPSIFYDEIGGQKRAPFFKFSANC